MTNVTHTKRRVVTIHDGLPGERLTIGYEIKVDGKSVGSAEKILIRSRWAYVFTVAKGIPLPNMTWRTMKELKVRILQLVVDDRAEFWKDFLYVPPRPEAITVRRAIKMTGISHSDIREFLREIRFFHRGMRRDQIGSYMVRRTMENLSKWNYGEVGRAWLARNPLVGIYKEFEVEPGVWICPVT